MTVFDTQFAAVGFPLLLTQFGESITYAPRAGALRVISAIVERNPPGVLDATGNAVFPSMTVRAYNSATTGIASTEVDIGKDELLMLLKIGDTTAKRFSLLTLLSQDSGVTQLAVT